MATTTQLLPWLQRCSQLLRAFNAKKVREFLNFKTMASWWANKQLPRFISFTHGSASDIQVRVCLFVLYFISKLLSFEKNKDSDIYLQPTVGTTLLNSFLTNRSARQDFPTPEPPSSIILTLKVRTGLLQVSLRGWVASAELCVFISSNKRE